MKRLHRLCINRLPWQQILLIGLITMMIPTSYSCREKNTPTRPDTTENPTGRWVMYLFHDGQHLDSSNDTITVRVYNPQGELAGGLRIESSNTADSINVSPAENTTADTIGSPWGTLTPIVLWGYNSAVLFDTVYCTAFESGVEVVDTLAIFSLINDF